MTVKEMQAEIIRLKKEKNICILAHAYQSHDIVEIADFVGDSFGLSIEASKTDCGTVIMCGVKFMAETVKMLSPGKRVLLPAEGAGCPMAEQMTVNDILLLKAKHPGAAVVAYINTTAELKTVCDVCVTSASALKIVKKLPQKDIIFVPDINLGSYIAEKCPEKNIILFNGGCPHHASVTEDDVKRAKASYPDAELLVHPECPKEVVSLADFVGSTTAIMKYAGESSGKRFIIGTENSIVEHLRYDYLDKAFYPLSKRLVCSDMKLTTLPDVLNCINGTSGKEITLSEETRLSAVKCIERMLELG